jgi:hypothetical protein
MFASASRIGKTGADAAGFSRTMTPEQIMDRLEERVGPKGRRLFQNFLRKVNKLQAEQQLEALIEVASHDVVGTIETPGFDWFPEEDSEAQRDEFEALVKQLRGTQDEKTRFVDAVALRTIALPQNLGQQIIDVLARPSSALSKLVPNDKVSFRGISNEIARSRLSECYFLRKDSSDLAGIAECSGFSLPNKEALIDCINGNRCIPRWSDRAYRTMLLISPRASLRDLAVKNDFPRVLSFGKLGDSINALNRCRTEPNASVDNCVLEVTLPAETKRIWRECMKEGNEKSWQSIGSTNFYISSTGNFRVGLASARQQSAGYASGQKARMVGDRWPTRGRKEQASQSAQASQQQGYA